MEDITAITTIKRFAPKAAGPQPWEAPEEGHQWERAAEEEAGDTRLRAVAAAADDRRAALNGTAWNTGSVEQRSREEIHENYNARKYRTDCHQPRGGRGFAAGNRVHQHHQFATGSNVDADLRSAGPGPTVIHQR
jgi:hypothetical protein